MRTTSTLAAFVLCGTFWGCDSASVAGKTPEEQGRIAAETLCQKQAECGDVDINCDVDANNNRTCTGSIRPIPYEACVADIQEEATRDFQRCMLTDAQAEAVDVCLSDFAGVICPSQQQVDEAARAVEQGGSVELLSFPASCEALDNIFDECEENSSNNPPVACNSESMSADSNMCEFTWECSSNRFEIKCTRANGTDSCECIENGLSGRTFSGPTVCEQSTETAKNLARQECGFNL